MTTRRESRKGQLTPMPNMISRGRNVKPSLGRDDLLQDLEIQRPELKPMAVYLLLPTHCAKNGVFPWNPRQLKLDVMPFVDYDLSATLELFYASGLVKKFSVGGVEYGFVVRFKDEQRISGKEAQAASPYPDLPSGNTGEATEKHLGNNEETTGEATEKRPLPLNTEVLKSEVLNSEVLNGANPNDAPTPLEPEYKKAPRSASSAEPSVSSPTFVTIPLNDGKEHPVTEADVMEWSKLYPAVDVQQELRNMKGWCLSHPSRRKTDRGVVAFVVSWLKREQDKAPVRPTFIPPKTAAMEATEKKEPKPSIDLPADLDREAGTRAWQTICTSLKSSMNQLSFDTWVKPTKGHGVSRSSKTLFVRVPTAELMELETKRAEEIAGATERLGLKACKFFYVA